MIGTGCPLILAFPPGHEYAGATDHGHAEDREAVGDRFGRPGTLVTSNLPFDEWTEVFGSERLIPRRADNDS